jgi:hypothetical protein
LEEEEMTQDELSKRMDGIDKTLSEMKRRLNGFEPHVVEAMFDEMKKDVAALHDRLKAEIMRVCVVTELCYASRGKPFMEEVQSACIWALDQEGLLPSLADGPIGEARVSLLSAYRSRAVS